MRVTLALLLLFTTAFTGCEKFNFQQHKTEKMEQQKIIEAITAIFNGVDERDWNKIQNVLAERVVMDYTSLNGGQPLLQTPQEVTDAWAQFLPGFDKTFHQVWGFEITRKDKEASVHYNGKADHYLDNEVWTVEGTFDTELQKQNSRWLVTKHKFNLSKQSGNIDLPKKAMEAVKQKRSSALKEKVTFISDGLVLSGDLYRPKNFNASKKHPAILVGGSWTTVKEQMSGLYASKLAEQGYITLAIDPRHFGASEGQPRFWENPAAKISDYKNAISYLTKVEGVDAKNIFLTAICASAGYMANVTVQDKRVKGLAMVAAWLHDAESVKPLYGGEEGVRTRLEQGKEAKKKFAETGEVKYILTVSKTDTTAAMSGNFDYYLDANRGAVPQWSADKFAVMSWDDWLKFDPMPVAKNINQPTLMIHSDSAALPNNAKKFFADIPHKNKILRWTEGSQFDFYDQPKQVSESVGAIDRFFKEHLR